MRESAERPDGALNMKGGEKLGEWGGVAVAIYSHTTVSLCVLVLDVGLITRLQLSVLCCVRREGCDVKMHGHVCTSIMSISA